MSGIPMNPNAFKCLNDIHTSPAAPKLPSCYEEQVLAGVLCARVDPNSEFTAITPERFTKMLLNARTLLGAVNPIYHECVNMLDINSFN